MNRIFISLTIILVIIFPSVIFPQSAPITIDAIFDDWTSNLTTVSDAPESISGVDLLEMQVSNDEYFLFIRIKTNIEFDLLDNLMPQGICLYFDTDNNENTGLHLNAGYGAELAIKFNERYADYYVNPNSKVTFSDFSFRASPTITSDEFEIAIKRDAVPDGIHPLFSSSTIKILLINEENNDSLPNGGTVFKYTFDETPVQAFTPTNIVKEDTNNIRILVYNTLADGLTKSARLPHFENIITVLNPDIIGFSESRNTDAQKVKVLLDDWLPLDNSDGWFVHKKIDGDLITASRWEIVQDWNTLSRQFPTLIDLPETYHTDLLFTNAHLKCCSGDILRQEEVDEYIAFILDAKSEGGIITLPNETPFVYGGDLNLVGYAQQLSTLLTGNIQNTSTYGEGGQPDWDNTDVTAPICIQTDKRMDYTWRYDNSSYPPGKLDFIIYSDAVMNAQKSFVLQTEVMPQHRLQLYGLNQNNTGIASDHFPVVTDFSINASDGILHQKMLKHSIYPNPASTKINISFNNAGRHLITITDLYGRNVFSDEMLSKQSSIDIKILTAGVYFITIIAEDGSKENHKLIKL